jgi:hypothetical protein
MPGHLIRRCRPGLTGALLCLLCAAAGGGTPEPSAAALAAAAARGLAWIDAHPAGPRDGGLADVLDEGVGFLVMSRLVRDAAARKRFHARFVARMTALHDMPEFARWAGTVDRQLTGYYHRVLAAHLMRQAGSPTDLQATIVAQAQWALASTPRCDPTKRLTIALFLERLDEEPVISLPAALAASRIERIARGNPPALPEHGSEQQRLGAALDLYALVHEIVALTDFGREPPPPWLEARREALGRYLPEAVAWAGAAGNIDLLSELLLAARFVAAPVQDVLPDALRLLLASQQPDGSWGADETTVRANRYRHAVFTATTVLLSVPAGSLREE